MDERWSGRRPRVTRHEETAKPADLLISIESPTGRPGHGEMARGNAIIPTIGTHHI